jgi:hypothetical protein
VVSIPCLKLALKYFGPYKILQNIGTVADRLKLPASAQVHPIFHVSQLKQFTPDHSLVFLELPTALQLDLAELEPEQILECMLTKKGNAAVIQVRIKWRSLPASMGRTSMCCSGRILRDDVKQAAREERSLKESMGRAEQQILAYACLPSSSYPLCTSHPTLGLYRTLVSGITVAIAIVSCIERTAGQVLHHDGEHVRGGERADEDDQGAE